MNHVSKTLVEQELSRELIYSIGVYVQLCARIEKLIIKSICLAEKATGERAKFRYAELSQLSTRELISSLKNISSSLTKDHLWYRYFEELRPYLHKFVDNRHLAVHGVISSNLAVHGVISPNNGARVFFFDKNSKEAVDHQFEQNEVEFMVDAADHIARSLDRFCKEADL
ncbi:MAG: hypothetical protein AAF066_19870 [Pseudomonadota bacterium]